MPNKRPAWDEYFLNIADLVSTRSTCDRLFVGAVLVRDRMILSTGYNGSPRHTDQCDGEGHYLVDNHCVRTVHAEENTIAQAAYHGISTKNATLYTNYFPCEKCVKLLINAGVSKIAYRKMYSNLNAQFSLTMLKQAGVEIVELGEGNHVSTVKKRNSAKNK